MDVHQTLSVTFLGILYQVCIYKFDWPLLGVSRAKNRKTLTSASTELMDV
jgi:hypothetical protein